MSSVVLDLRITAEPLAGAALVRDYYHGAPALAPFYAGYPWDEHAWERTGERVSAHFDAPRLQAMRGAVRAGTDEAGAKLAGIAAGHGFFVQTGQQAGLLGGPLYTVHKILTAIRLAQIAERALNVPVAPLFWVAADDHDFDEVNHAYVLTPDNDVRRLALAEPERPQSSMARQPIGARIGAVLSELEGLLPAGEFGGELLDAIKRAYTPEQTMAGAFTELIAHLFERFGLLITSSADPVVKQLGTPLLQREIRAAEAHEALIRTQTARLLDAGYHEQVSVRAGAANISYEDEHGRDRLMRAGSQWTLSRSKARFSADEIERLLAAEPLRFSANALLRPVVASHVFPTIAYVGGPAEISYFAQIGCLFGAHEVPMPLVVPRLSVEIVEHKVQKVLDKFSLQASDIRVPYDRLATRIIREDLPAEIPATMAALRDEIAAGYARLVEATSPIDPTLRGPLESARNASHKTLEAMEKKIVRHLKKRNDIGLDQLRRASANLFPNGEPQERVLSAVTYLARYGPGLLDEVAAAIDFEFGQAAPAWTGVQCK